MTPVSHAWIGLHRSRCTSCMICVRECPVWCISLSSHPQVSDQPVSGRGRTRSHNILDDFRIDYGLCIYCGMCIEECPFDALVWVDGNHPAHTECNLVATISQLSLDEQGQTVAASSDPTPGWLR